MALNAAEPIVHPGIDVALVAEVPLVPVLACIDREVISIVIKKRIPI